jgi:hypothetical protein
MKLLALSIGLLVLTGCNNLNQSYTYTYTTLQGDSVTPAVVPTPLVVVTEKPTAIIVVTPVPTIVTTPKPVIVPMVVTKPSAECISHRPLTLPVRPLPPSASLQKLKPTDYQGQVRLLLKYSSDQHDFIKSVEQYYVKAIGDYKRKCQ